MGVIRMASYSRDGELFAVIRYPRFALPYCNPVTLGYSTVLESTSAADKVEPTWVGHTTAHPNCLMPQSQVSPIARACAKQKMFRRTKENCPT